MRKIIVVPIILLAVSAVFGQDLLCNGNQCSSTYRIGDKSYTTTCTGGAGTLSCHTSDPDSSYNPGDGIRKFMAQGMSFEDAMKAEQARHEAVMMETPGELEARRELCEKGILKADRCDFSKPHPNGYRLPPPPQFQEGTPAELDGAIKVGHASKCIIHIFPDGADIFVDGVKVGKPSAPFIILRKDKPRTIAVKLDGFKNAEKQVTPDGNLIVLGFLLEKAPDDQVGKAASNPGDQVGHAVPSQSK